VNLINRALVCDARFERERAPARPRAFGVSGVRHDAGRQIHEREQGE
jgi:hypothetical protein